MLTDLKLAFRTLAKSPGFTAVAITTLAAAIGVNSAVFSLINGLALRPLIPLRPSEVVNVFTARRAANKDYRQFSYAEYRALRDPSAAFSDVAALTFAPIGIGRDSTTRRSLAFATSENYFSLCGVTPALGRFYTAAECRPHADTAVVVTSHSLWQRLGGGADFVGSTLRLNGRPYTVIGVAPAGFSGQNALIAPDVWLPLGMFDALASSYSDKPADGELANPTNYTLNIVARMAPGVTRASLPAQLPVLAKRLNALLPPDSKAERELQVQSPSRFSLSTSPANDGPVPFVAAALMGMAGCVLIIACLNIANMLLARGTSRAREIGIRLALGASRTRIVRLLVVEGLLLSIAGGALGLLLAIWSNDALLGSLQSRFGSMNFSLTLDTRPDFRVLGVTFLFCLAATLIFALGPALKSARSNVISDLKLGGVEAASRDRFTRFFSLRHLLVMGQIALSLVLVFSAALFLRGALNAGGLRTGFSTANDIVAELDFSLVNRPQAEGQRLIAAAEENLRRIPGVQVVAAGTLLPYSNITSTKQVIAANAPAAQPGDSHAPDTSKTALNTSTTPGYFSAIGVHLLRGRDFTATEASDSKSAPVAIVDEFLAQDLYPKGDALGQHIRYTSTSPSEAARQLEIVGIVSGHRQAVIDKNPHEYPDRLFVPLAQAYNPDIYLHVRFAHLDDVNTTAAITAVRNALRTVDPELPILQIAPFADIAEKDVGLWLVRVGATLFGVLGGVALLLAAVGVYGVKAYAVARRTREIGIRMALGAHPRDVFALVMRQGVRQVACAILVGLLLAVGVGQVLASMLYKVSPADPLALGIAVLVLSGSALLATFLPARRAAAVDPMVALRME